MDTAHVFPDLWEGVSFLYKLLILYVRLSVIQLTHCLPLVNEVNKVNHLAFGLVVVEGDLIHFVFGKHGKYGLENSISNQL
jgi:hypothetical protein